MLKDLFTLTQIISGIAIIFFIYLKTKDRCSLYTFILITYCLIMFSSFRVLYPHIPTPSPTIQYMTLLAITGIPFLIMLVIIGNEAEKNREKTMENIQSIFTMSRGNIIFWGIIILLNLTGFILEMGK